MEQTGRQGFTVFSVRKKLRIFDPPLAKRSEAKVLNFPKTKRKNQVQFLKFGSGSDFANRF